MNNSKIAAAIVMLVEFVQKMISDQLYYCASFLSIRMIRYLAVLTSKLYFCPKRRPLSRKWHSKK